MTTVELPPEPTGRRRGGALAEPAGRLTVAAATLLLAGLAVAVGGSGAAALPLALTVAGIVLGLFVLGPRCLAALRRHPAPLAAGALAIVALALVALAGLVARTDGFYGIEWLVRPAFELLPPLLVILVATGGVVLLADGLRARLGRGGTPWQRLAGGRATAPGARPWRAAAGLGLVIVAALLGLWLVAAYARRSGLFAPLLLFVVGAGALAVIAVPVVVAGLARADHADIRTAREDERQRVAAHLHDSVLQTLALVQRQAHDPAAVARLARRQEHALRAWMAGEAELGSETLAAALRAAVAEVEDDLGADVELTVLGDRALDRPGEALAGAAREALRNAARHAPGSRIYVFVQASAAGAEAFIRDDGPGFDLAHVPAERRGVRDAIAGRMAAAGGRATIDSAPGEGTEIALRIGGRP